MDIDFMMQDTFALTRPQWKLASDFDEAGRAFADAVAQNYKSQEAEKAAEPEDADDGSSSDGGDDDELQVPEMDDVHSSSEEVETEVTPVPTATNGRLNDILQNLPNGDNKQDSDFEEHIVVTRHEEERDPEAEADFDRELAKMMTESIDSRKFERKPLFDVPLPMRRANRDTSHAGDESPTDGTATPPRTMAFSLMTKKGNRQQVQQAYS